MEYDYSKHGAKVRFIGCTPEQKAWGGNDDPNPILNEGSIYRLDYAEVHSWHTKVILVGFPDHKFNSACFEEVNP